MPHASLVVRGARHVVDAALVALISFVVAMLLLARVLPLVTGGATFVVAGGSMEPAIPMGSLVHVVPVPADRLAVGDVVTLLTGPSRAVFTHRIVRLATLPDGRYLETRGDANPAADPSLVPASAVVGRVALALPYLGFGVALVGAGQGLVLLAALGVMLLAAGWLLEAIDDDRVAAARPHPAGAGTAGDAPRTAPGNAARTVPGIAPRTAPRTAPRDAFPDTGGIP